MAVDPIKLRVLVALAAMPVDELLQFAYMGGLASESPEHGRSIADLMVPHLKERLASYAEGCSRLGTNAETDRTVAGLTRAVAAWETLLAPSPSTEVRDALASALERSP